MKIINKYYDKKLKLRVLTDKTKNPDTIIRFKVMKNKKDIQIFDAISIIRFINPTF